MIKYGSRAWAVLMVLASNRGRVKSVAHLMEITSRKEWEVRKSAAMLLKHKLASLGPDGYQITERGAETLAKLASDHGRQMIDDTDMVDKYHRARGMT